MVRTKASAGGSSGGRKAMADSAPRKSLASTSSPSSKGAGNKVNKYAGGNAACARPTPDWQKGIAGFLVKTPGKENRPEEANVDTEVNVETDKDSGCSSSSSSAAASSAPSSPPAKSSKSTEEEESAGPSSPEPVALEKNGIIESDDED